MKLVINREYHYEYNLSLDALKELIKRKADCMPSFTLQFFFGGEYDPKKFLWEQYYKEALPDFMDVGDGFLMDDNKTFIYEGMVYFYGGDGEWSDRKCKDLIELVETWGDAVNGEGAELRVVEIPDDIEWLIYGDGVDEGVHQVGHFWN